MGRKKNFHLLRPFCSRFMFYVDFTLILNGTAWRRKAEENKVKDEGRRWCQNTVVSITTQANQATGTPDLHVSLAELAR